MNDDAQGQQIDFSVDSSNLYREEGVSDLKVASIRQLIPINMDGTEDKSRTRKYMGHTQLMSPQGPVPIQSPLEGNNLEEAIGNFPEAMKIALDKVIENIKKAQEQQQQQQQQQPQNDSRIIMPGR